jgi:putative ABC transport system permease protein
VTCPHGKPGGYQRASARIQGASRGRLVRETLVESLLLCGAGGLLGILVARWCTDLLGSRIIIGSGRMGVEIPLDVRVVGFALALVLITALALGTVPA